MFASGQMSLAQTEGFENFRACSQTRKPLATPAAETP